MEFQSILAPRRLVLLVNVHLLVVALDVEPAAVPLSNAVLTAIDRLVLLAVADDARAVGLLRPAPRAAHPVEPVPVVHWFFFFAPADQGRASRAAHAVQTVSVVLRLLVLSTSHASATFVLGRLRVVPLSVPISRPIMLARTRLARDSPGVSIGSGR